MTRPRLLRLLPELDFGGTESLVVIAAQELDRSRWELHVTTFHRAGAAAAQIREAGVPVHELGVTPSVRSWRSTLALLAHLRRLRPQLIHASIAEANFHALIAGRLLGIPVIAEEVGLPAHRLRARVAYGLLYRSAARIIGVSAEACDYLRQVDRAPAERVQLVHNCASSKFFPEPRPEPAPHAAPALRLLHVGRLVPVKNQALLLRAFARHLRAHPASTLSIVGAGPLRGELEALIAELGLGERARLEGFREDVRELLASHDSFVLPSHSEGSSIAMIEAMSQARLCLGSRARGLVDALGEQAAELTAPTTDEDAWVRLLDRWAAAPADERRQAALRLQGRAYTHFSPKAHLATLEALYARWLDR